MLVAGVSVDRVSIGEMSPHSAAIVHFHHPWKIIQTQSNLQLHREYSTSVLSVEAIVCFESELQYFIYL